MGMFDNVKAPLMGCPGCGADLDFQTKDLDCTLATYTVQQVLSEQSEDNYGRRSMQMLGGCDQCQLWVDVNVRTQGRPSKNPDPWIAGLMERMAALEEES